MREESGEIKTVLHVLPHPGGGGETYVDVLSRMEGYAFERIYLSPSAQPRDAFHALPRTFRGVLASADLVHVHGEVAAGICLPVLAARRSVVTLHGLHLLRRSTGVKRWVAEANLGAIVRAANRTICVADTEQADVIAVTGPARVGKIAVIYNGVDRAIPVETGERLTARDALGIREGEVAGVWVGGLNPVKDPLTAARGALEAGHDESPLVMLFAGDGPLRPALDRLAAETGGDRVHLLGFRADIRAVLAAADFYVNSSLREGLSFAVLEAMALGLTPVVSDVPGNLEAVGDAGIVVAPGDQRAFAAAFTACLDERNRSSLGDRARARVAEHFRADAMVAETQRVYDETLA